MKIFISADLEGVNGIVAPEDIEEAGSGYPKARILMTEEINQVIAGAFEGGATEILVCDSHNVACNIIYDKLDPRVSILRGDTRRNSMIHSIDESYDGLILFGYHAKFGTPMAVLDHSFSPTLIRDIRINGTSYGELGINSMFAASKGVPAIMTTGDKALSDEAKSFSTDIDTAIVKYAEGRYSARCLPRAQTQQLLFDTAKEAVSSIQSKKPVQLPEIYEMELEFQQVNMADGAMRVKGAIRKDAFTVSIKCDDMDDLMATRQVLFNAASGFYNPMF